MVNETVHQILSAVGNGRGDENIFNDQQSESGADEEPGEKSFDNKR